jgi:Ca2+-binding RTX toxin-like protein
MKEATMANPRLLIAQVTGGDGATEQRANRRVAPRDDTRRRPACVQAGPESVLEDVPAADSRSTAISWLRTFSLDFTRRLRPARSGTSKGSFPNGTRAIRAAALAAGILGSLAGAPAALGSYAYEYTLSDGSKELTYYAEFFGSDFGQDNSLGISGSYTGGYTISESTPGMYLGFGTGCQRGTLGNNQAVCGGGVSVANMFLGDGNDQVAAPISGTRAFLYGETGNDTLTGGPSSDWLRGGSGDDVLNGNDGNDNLSPEGGNDKLVGGPGPDYAWFDDYYQPVTVTLNGQADDGATGEHADVQTENVIAGPEADTLTGNAGANTLHGMNGDDVIEGRGGADYLIGHFGDDTIWALDRARDYITCGDGYDQVLADSRDDVSDDCESVSRA